MGATVEFDAQLSAFADEVGPSGAVAAVGARTRWTLGGELAPATRLVSAPTGIVEVHPSEMIVRVRAGESVASLDHELRTVGQRCGLPDRGGTVGGAVAVGENHVEVLGRGTVGQSVLQIRYVGDDGSLVSGGGETVKNVSGFDLPRLLVGSLGTLGLIGEVLIRTNPVPPESRWFMSDDVDPRETRQRVLRPGAILWDGTTTHVLLEGHGADVEAELGALSGAGQWSETEGPPTLPPHRWSITPSDIFSGVHDFGAGFVASVGVGIVFAHSPQAPRPVAEPVRELQRRMKMQFDPEARFAPGRSAGW